MTLVCYDSVTAAHLPTGGAAYGAYIDGLYANEAAVRARFPHAHIITIAVNATHDGMCLDVERGDAYPSQAPAWVRRQLGHGVYRPVLYASTYLMPTVLAALSSAGISRNTVRLWSAHYVNTRHVCSPAACHAPFTADGTQWAGSPGNSPGPYDVSVLNDNFFAQPHPVPVEDPDMAFIVQPPDGKGASYLIGGAAPLYVALPSDVDAFVKAGAKVVVVSASVYADVVTQHATATRKP